MSCNRPSVTATEACLGFLPVAKAFGAASGITYSFGTRGLRLRITELWPWSVPTYAEPDIVPLSGERGAPFHSVGFVPLDSRGSRGLFGRRGLDSHRVFPPNAVHEHIIAGQHLAFQVLQR